MDTVDTPIQCIKRLLYWRHNSSHTSTIACYL